MSSTDIDISNSNMIAENTSDINNTADSSAAIILPYRRYAVVSACYNVAEYLNDFLTSLTGQTVGFENNIQVIYDDRVLERNTNSVMYRPDSSINLIEFYSPNNDIIYHDCEGFKSILKRASDFIEDIKQKYKDKSVLVVSHLDFCKAMYCCLKNEYDINKIISFNQDNCEICKYIL